MTTSSTKPQGVTSYKQTAFSTIPRSKLIKLEIEGTKKGLEYLSNIIGKDKNISITSEFICTLHNVAFGWIFPDWEENIEKYR